MLEKKENKYSYVPNMAKNREKKVNIEQKRVISEKKKHKYSAKATEVDGIRFDSKREAERYQQLKLMESSGEIRYLARQKTFILQPSFVDNEGNRQRAINYVCDFFYYEPDTGKWIVEDVKSNYTKTMPVYRIKKKMFLLHYPEYKFVEYV